VRAEPDGRYVDWSGLPGAALVDATTAGRTVDAMAALWPSVGAVYGHELCDKMREASPLVRAAVSTYYGFRLLSMTITPSAAFRYALTLHYVEGFAADPDGVSLQLADEHRALFGHEAPPRVAAFLTAAAARFQVSLRPRLSA